MKNVKLGTKLIGGFLITALVALIIGLVGTYEINKLTGHIHEIGEVRLPSVSSLQTLENQIRRIQQSTRTMMSPYLDRETRLNQAKNIEDARVIYREAWDVYEPLPQTAEEAKVWEQFVPKVKEAATLNNQAAQMSEQLIEMDVLNPDKYMGNLQMFTGDHYALEAKVGEFLLTGHEFDGGTDPTKCRFGKWMASYSTTNPKLANVISQIKAPHDRFHQAVAEIKEAMESGDAAKATEVYTGTMVPAAREVFGHFDELRAVAHESVSLFDKMATLLLGEARKSNNEAMGMLEELVEINETVGHEAVVQAGADAQQGSMVAVVGMIVGVIIAIGLGIS